MRMCSKGLHDLDLPRAFYMWPNGKRMCRECKNALWRLYYKTAHGKEHGRERRRMQYYGVSKEEYDQRVKEQNGQCACCGQSPTGSGLASILMVDHDHRCCLNPPPKICGKCTRGLVCVKCNTSIGRYERGILDKAYPLYQAVVNYVERWRKTEIWRNR